MIYHNKEDMRQSVRNWKRAYELTILMIVLLCLSLAPWADAQSIERMSINSLGGSTGNPNVEHSAGEAVILTKINGSVMLSQGFHQTKTAGYVSQSEFTISSFGISVYPNPARNYLNIIYNSQKGTATKVLRLELYNANGQLIRAIPNLLNTSDDVIRIDISTLSAGVYHLNLNNGSFQLNHKIIKTN